MNEIPQRNFHCVDAVAAVNCILQAAVGRFERCPGASCPLWDGGECVFEETKRELLGRPYVAEHLLELRHSLVALRRAESRSGFRSPLHGALKRHMFKVRGSLAASS